VIALNENGIREAYNIANEKVFDFIYKESLLCQKFLVVVEDLMMYNLKTGGDSFIKTAKFLGQIEWRLKDVDIKFNLIPRWEIKQWIFLQYRTIVEPMILDNMRRSTDRKKKKAEDAGIVFKARNASPTFVYVNDRCVIAAMRKRWGIEPCKGGRSKPLYNLKDHGWQALGLASYFLVREKIIL
jgi:hypothetical protein